MGERRTIIHVNPNLEHQVKIGDALKAGFDRHDKPSEISHKADTPADLHVVLGPWFALRQWKHANTLYIDRAYWGDPKCISIHWLKNGEKHFGRSCNYRSHPQSKPYKHGDRTIILCDYKQRPVFEQNIQATIRLHPSEVKPHRSLEQDLANHDIAIGKRTTALVDAAIAGLKVITDDTHSPVWEISNSTSYIKRDQWLVNLAWHNWSLVEIANGDMWHVLGKADECQ